MSSVLSHISTSVDGFVAGPRDGAWDESGDPGLESVKVVASPAATHVKDRVHAQR